MSQPDEPVTVENGVTVSGDMSGTVVQIGAVHYGTPGPAAWLYLGTVRDVAPGRLVGREAELAELTRFCLAPDPSPGYVWWRAEAWSGKTALMSTFVLDAPEEVQVVSFLITARDTRADTRAGFLREVVPQLAAVSEVRAPEPATESDFRGLLETAARVCADRGRRLILVVDGLDEDRGAGDERGAKSIAELLPRRPAHGLRVIVSGRPNPGIPAAVRDDHPLRDPAIVRELAPSPAASAAKYAMKLDLERLLADDAGEAKDVLGLLVAARSGLSRRDLEELGGTHVSEVLNSVKSRAFSRRHARWRPETAPEVYLLGHQGLFAEAAEKLGEQAVRAYGEQITKWAESYRAKGWPPETPQFLLHGYPRLLQEAGQLDRVVECVTDLPRQRRLIEVAGGEEAAQAEIAEVHAAFCASPEPDVMSLVKLTMHRDDLSDRNARTPERLPALWARMGDFDRAEALARSISAEDRRADAIFELLEVMVAAGLIDRVDRLLVEALREDQHPDLRTRLVSAIAGTGDFARARSMAEGLADSDWRARALLVVAAAERPEDVALLRTVADEIREGVFRHLAIRWVAISLVEAGFLESAIELSAGLNLSYLSVVIERAARALLPSGGEISDVHRIAGKLGDESARKLFARMDLEAAARVDPEVAVAGLSAFEEWQRESLLLKIIEIALEDDNVAFAESALGGLGSSYDELGLRKVLKHLVAKGEMARAETLLRSSLSDREGEREFAARAAALTAMAEGAFEAGDLEAARELAWRAEAIARQVDVSYRYTGALRSFVEFVTTTKNVDAAERLAAVVLVSDLTAYDVEPTARLLAESGDVNVAESLAFRLGDPAEVMKTLTPLLRRLREQGQTGEIRRIVERVDGLPGELDARYAVEFYCAAGFPDRALERVDTVENRYQRGQARCRVIEELCAMGRDDDAVGIVRQADSDDRAEYAEALAKALGAAKCDDGIEILLGLELRGSSAVRTFLGELARHDGERALRLAVTSLESFDLERALLEIAGSVDGPLRSRVLAEYMRGGDWARVLPLLNPAEQAGLTEVVDQFVTLQEARLGLRPEDG
ncbi:hypothetical protein M8542_35515 [Amycolatopsis sp. OK19-0408]|uniref:Nephrocystin 3-like N-terminal domain-containing protein n=1 Tax=Amycolatopsis iheyensis TaxID=2945988 RepID=A0A9X2NJX8_9PSEU|nr:hypothetical protein [Amycolatopsis iheyensis]MCR6488150.1 hypothetical protein [Amycolatopsis iheyensis]